MSIVLCWLVLFFFTAFFMWSFSSSLLSNLFLGLISLSSFLALLPVLISKNSIYSKYLRISGNEFGSQSTLVQLIFKSTLSVLYLPAHTRVFPSFSPLFPLSCICTSQLPLDLGLVSECVGTAGVTLLKSFLLS